MAKILVTGGCGYIGSHTIVDLIENGYDIISVDNNARSTPAILKGIENITGKNVKNYKVDLCNFDETFAIFQENEDIDGIIHFAAYKEVGESVERPFTLWLHTLNSNRANAWFKRLQLVSSAAFSIGHGGNDAQKVMGIITAALIANGSIAEFEQMPTWVPLACYAAIALGTMTGGWKIIKTMGTRITKVTPFEGVAAETAGAITLFVTEALKIPVSTTHTITGAIMGVGATKRLSAVRWGVTLNLLIAWVLTIPVSALLAAGVYYLVSLIL